MATRGVYLLQLVLWMLLFRVVQAKEKDCGPHCFGRETSIIFISVIITLICLAVIIGIITSIWCCCCRNGGELIHKISKSRSGSRPAYTSEYNTRTSALSTRPTDELENDINPSLQTQAPSTVEPTQTDRAPPSYEEVMNKLEGESSLLDSSV